MRILLIGVIFVFLGCSTQVQSIKQQPQITRTHDKMLGTLLGCSKKLPGFTAEGCGSDWGKEVYINVE